MAFIQNATTFFSFAEYSDVTARDQRVFEANEGLTESDVEDMLVRSSERILTLIKDSDWWQRIWGSPAPDVNALQIIARQDDFTDLCVFHCIHYYLLPKIADFSDEENSERQKLDYYRTKFDELAMELINAGDWYDFDDDDIIQDGEIYADHGRYVVNQRRVR